MCVCVCVHLLVRFIESPQSQSAPYGGTEVVEFDCTGCGHQLSFSIIANNVVLADLACRSPSSNTNNQFVVKQKEFNPFNCTLCIYTSLLPVNVTKLLVQCSLGSTSLPHSITSDNATLTLVTSGKEFAIFVGN